MIITLRLQLPPREQWMLRVVHRTAAGEAIVRTWLTEYAPEHRPPLSVVAPLAALCTRIARAALEEDVADARFSVAVMSFTPGAPS